MKISPIDTLIVKCIATVLEEKPTLVRSSDTMYDSQFLHLLGLYGIPTSRTLIGLTMNYLEEIGVIARVEKKSNYAFVTIHYVLTDLGKNLPKL